MLMAGLGLGIVAGITGWCMLYVAGWLLILRVLSSVESKSVSDVDAEAEQRPNGYPA